MAREFDEKNWKNEPVWASVSAQGAPEITNEERVWLHAVESRIAEYGSEHGVGSDSEIERAAAPKVGIREGFEDCGSSLGTKKALSTVREISVIVLNDDEDINSGSHAVAR